VLARLVKEPGRDARAWCQKEDSVKPIDKPLVLALALGCSAPVAAGDAETVAALDTEYQAAVARNDAAAMDRILADDMVLVLGNGTVHTKAELLEEARSGRITYEQQIEVDDSQKVRVWGDTAVVTAKLWVKGTRDGKAFDRKLWFSDTYVRTRSGWRYAFGQASLALAPQP
jgi:ketosteroid isomerase-like protein